VTLKSEQVTVGQTAVRVIAADNMPRHVYFHDDSSHPVFIGGADVTTSNGLHIPKNALLELFLPQHCDLWAVSGNADQTVSVLYQTD